jgi:hypothetical protein
MIKNFINLIIFSLLTCTLVYSQQQNGVTVEEMVLCTSVEDRQPVGVDTAFVNTLERVYCFTKIASDVDSTSISHVWFYNDQEVARVDLAVKAKTWRTWSSKRLMEIWTGKWRVDIVSKEGTLVRSKEFLVQPAAQ